MPTITLEVSDELAPKLNLVRERLPELLALSLDQPAVPARIYREILQFLAGHPTPEQISNLRPSTEAVSRLKTLLAREREGMITDAERRELDELEQIEHMVVMIKTGNLAFLKGTP